MDNKKKSNKGSSVRRKAHRGVDRIMNKARNINKSGQEKYNRFKDKTIIMRENVGRMEINPEKLILIAVGIGAILGSILTVVMIRKR
ncbi:hypothetical protein COU54_01710 [Candidatus Pacearchaeota archaeon CG10_big_fil_rev_8_21_14_0_10_31_24]|nr:MAG: hypothetical protein COU54_01710 [Candidatus Pacearchaeota archaeon CG10_big_fil_rev_8_21_14_0_10_31_24]